jgi:hypothetical protein
MKKISELLHSIKGKSTVQQCPVYQLYNYGPFCEETKDEIPDAKGVYFAFEFDKEKAEEGFLFFKRLVYVGKASKDNTLKKRIGEHYTQHDLHYRETEDEVDMDSIAFYICALDDDDSIRDVEAAFIYKLQPPANTDGIIHYMGEKTPLLLFMINEFHMVDRSLYQSPVIIRTEDK